MKIVDHNKLEDKSWTKGLSKFTGMNFQEIKDYYRMDAIQLQAPQACSATQSASFAILTSVDNGAPDTWDW